MQQFIQHVAVKAVIVDHNNRALIVRKSNDNVRHSGNAGRYNLPGGKIQPGEALEAALKREVHEEVGLNILTIDPRPLLVGEWYPVVRGEQLQIIGIFFACREWRGQVTLDGEHDALAWVEAGELAAYDILSPEDQAIRRFPTTPMPLYKSPVQ